MRNKDFSQPYFNDFIHSLSDVITCESCKSDIEGEAQAEDMRLTKEEWKKRIELHIAIDDDIRDWFGEKYSTTPEFGDVKRRLIDGYKVQEIINDYFRSLKEEEEKQNKTGMAMK
jgi:hypothetical protein